MEAASSEAGSIGPDRDGERLALSRYLSSGQWDRVVPTALELLASNPESAYLHRSLGLGLIMTGEHARGRASLEKALSLNPDDDVCCWGMGLSLHGEQKHKAAEDWAKKAIQLDPECPRAWSLMGSICQSQDDFEQALRCGEKALSLQPDDAGIRLLIASARSQLPQHTAGDAQAQIADYEAILTLDPENDLAHAKLGVVHFNETKDYARAEACFRRALELDPTDTQYEKLLIKTLRKRDPVLRLLWLPVAPVGWILRLTAWSWKKKWPLVFMVFLFRFVVVIAASFAVIFGLFFWPVSKVYEMCTLADLHRRLGRLRWHTGPMKSFHRARFAVRMGAFLAVLVAFYGLLSRLFLHPETGPMVLKWLGILIVAVVASLYLIGLGSIVHRPLRQSRQLERRRALDDLSKQ